MADDDSTDRKNAEHQGVQLARALNNLVADLGADLELDNREASDADPSAQPPRDDENVLEDLTGERDWLSAEPDVANPEDKSVDGPPDEERTETSRLSSLAELMAETTVLSDETRALIEKDFLNLAATVHNTQEETEDMVSPQQMLGLASVPLGNQERRLEEDAGVESSGGSLVISLEGDHHFRYPIRRGEITIGRSSENDIQINSEFASRVHARIVMSDSGAEIVDACSRNGVVFGVHPVLRHSFKDGDVVMLGTTRITYRDGHR